LIGETEIQLRSIATTENKTTTSYSISKRKLLDHDEVRRLGDDKILIIAHNKQPVIDDQNIYYKNYEYTSKVRPVQVW
jgi:type IV secretion system protein VirD4